MIDVVSSLDGLDLRPRGRLVGHAPSVSRSLGTQRLLDLTMNRPGGIPLSRGVLAALGVFDAASTWAFYETFRLWLGDGTFDMDANTFKMALYLSTSNAATLTTNSLLADLTNEHANANGYTTGGVTMTGVTWTRSAATIKFTSNAGQWAASGSSIVARFAVIYASGTLNGHASPLVCYTLLDTTPADVTVTTGNTLTITPHANGIFTLT